MTIKLTRTNKVLASIAFSLAPIAFVLSLIYGYIGLVNIGAEFIFKNTTGLLK